MKEKILKYLAIHLKYMSLKILLVKSMQTDSLNQLEKIVRLLRLMLNTREKIILKQMFKKMLLISYMKEEVILHPNLKIQMLKQSSIHYQV